VRRMRQLRTLLRLMAKQNTLRAGESAVILIKINEINWRNHSVTKLRRHTLPHRMLLPPTVNRRLRTTPLQHLPTRRPMLQPATISRRPTTTPRLMLLLATTRLRTLLQATAKRLMRLHRTLLPPTRDMLPPPTLLLMLLRSTTLSQGIIPNLVIGCFNWNSLLFQLCNWSSVLPNCLLCPLLPCYSVCYYSVCWHVSSLVS
jgi:hypothetical protein